MADDQDPFSLGNYLDGHGRLRDCVSDEELGGGDLRASSHVLVPVRSSRRPERTAWHRPVDKIAIAFVSNAIKSDHQEYLKLGGLGFLLGDGNLNYGRENIVESYYTWHFWRGLSYSLDVQHIDHPGYNRDRGPAWVGSVRAHVDF